MNTGKLNRRISYTATATYISDEFGGKTQSVAGASTETWCSAKQLSMRELISYGLPVEYVVYEFGFHYDRGVNIVRGMNLTYESKTFKVNQIIEVDEAKQMVKVIATYQG